MKGVAMKHAEGSGSILKSRLARGVVPLVAALFVCALAAPEARGSAVPRPDGITLIDMSSSAGSISAESTPYDAGANASHAFDGVKTTRWLAKQTGGAWYFVYEFNDATKVSGYRLYNATANEFVKRAPNTWTVSGSLTGEDGSWTELDSRSGETKWATGEVRTYRFANDTAYKYYKFNCTANNGDNTYLQLYEIEFGLAVNQSATLADLTTATSGSATSWSRLSSDGYTGAKAFDEDKTTANSRWLASPADSMFVVYKFNEATAVNAISVYGGSDYLGGADSSNRAPKAWTFSGSQTGEDGSWTVLDAQTEETGWASDGEERYYQFINQTPYSYYKFDCTSLNGASADCLQIRELEFFHYNPGTPQIGDVSISRTDVCSYSVSATELLNAADTMAYIVSDGITVTTNVFATTVAEGVTKDGSISGLAAGKTYQVSVLATNSLGAYEKVAGTLYTGELTLGATTDANENGPVAGAAAVSRNASSSSFPLTVNYTISSSAAGAAEGTTWAAPAAVTIPACEATGYLLVTPLVDASVTEDVTVTVTLAAGNYEMPAVSAKTLQIINLVAPTGYNTWIATSNSLASIGSNWSEGHAPTASDNILFDGRFSTKNCEWDSAASATVASWTQNADYTGTVTFDTEFPDYSGATFTLFTVTGNCDLQGGAWSCRGNYNNFGVVVSMMQTTKTDKHWCLNVSVGGSMTVGSGSAINVTGRGYGYQTPNPNYSQSYGGYAFGGANSPYGSITEPFDPGMGCISQTDGNNKSKISGIGGGAVKLAVAGNLTVNGRIEAVGTMDQNIPRSGGTGGSIWIVANKISGSGTIDASACPKSFYASDQGVSIGSGGRIALYMQSPLAFPMANVLCSGTSYTGTGTTSKTRISGPGTIFVKDSTQTHGTLYVKQSRDVATSGNKWTGTPVMGDLSLDAVVLSGNAQLRIPAGTSLTLPSLSAVTTDNTSAGIAGIVCGGGTLNIGNGDQVLKSNVAFASPTPFAFPADLTLESGAHLGRVGGTFGQEFSHFDTNFTVSVAGNLTIPSGATAGASGCCAFTATDNAQLAAHGGQSLWASIRGYGTNAFDSVLNPSMPGGSRYRGFRAGGVFRLTVGGELALNGTISSDGSGARGNADTTDNQAAPAGGTLNLSLGSISGTGSITAQGGCGKYNYAGGAGGGRVAVRLTGNGSTFSDYWKTNITAYGVSFSGNNNGKASSAGTVYLQDASDGEAAGMVLIRNDLALEAGAVNNKAVTLYPGKGVGCDAPEAFKKTDLVVAGAAKVQLTDALKIAGLTIDSDSLIDLNGKTLTVKFAKVNGVKLAPGTYVAGSTVEIGEGKLGNYLVDTAEDAGGELVVKGGGFAVLLR